MPARCWTAGASRRIRFKANLPNYGVFDEKRLFARGPAAGPVTVRGIRVGVPICEDIWLEESEDYENVVECLAETGAEILVVPNGSPYARDKNDVRLSIAVARVTESGLPLVYLNQVGGQDELVFDGASFALNADLSVAAQLPAFAENITTLALDARPRPAGAVPGRSRRSSTATRATTPPACSACATMSGRTDFPACCSASPAASIRRCARRSRSMRWARSGSAASCCRSASPRRCRSTTRRNSRTRSASATRCCRSRRRSTALRRSCPDTFAGLPRDITEENLQARTRGTLLMAISNKTGAMVVTTGNKSEMSVGYATLYGDMNGGFNPIKDIYKTEVFRLSTLRNSWKPDGALGPSGEVIPVNIITRPPTAELRENQTDQDSLPPYDMLDAILERLVEREEPLASIVAAGFDPRGGGADRPAAQHRRVQAAAGGARRQGHAEEFRPRSPLSHHQQVSRRRQAVARTRRDAAVARWPRIGGSVRGLRSARGDKGRADRADRLVCPPRPAAPARCRPSVAGRRRGCRGAGRRGALLGGRRGQLSPPAAAPSSSRSPR